MKFSSSIFLAAAANGVFGAAVPPVTDKVNVDPSIVDTAVVEATGVVAQLVGLVAPVIPSLQIIKQDIASYLGFINFELPKPDLSVVDSVEIVKTAQVFVEGAGVTQVYSVAIERVVQTATEVTDNTIAGPTVEDTLQTLKGIDTQAALKFFQHVYTVLPTNINLDSIFVIFAPKGRSLREYLGLPTPVEASATDALKEIQVVRFINGKFVTLTVSIRVLGISLVRSWSLGK